MTALDQRIHAMCICSYVRVLYQVLLLSKSKPSNQQHQPTNQLAIHIQAKKQQLSREGRRAQLRWTDRPGTQQPQAQKPCPPATPNLTGNSDKCRVFLQAASANRSRKQHTRHSTQSLHASSSPPPTHGRPQASDATCRHASCSATGSQYR